MLFYFTYTHFSLYLLRLDSPRAWYSDRQKSFYTFLVALPDGGQFSAMCERVFKIYLPPPGTVRENYRKNVQEFCPWLYIVIQKLPIGMIDILINDFQLELCLEWYSFRNIKYMYADLLVSSWIPRVKHRIAQYIGYIWFKNHMYCYSILKDSYDIWFNLLYRVKTCILCIVWIH